jgi:PilZ domain
MTSPTRMLPFTEQAHGLESPVQLIEMERRSKMRYPLVLKVRYRILRPKLHLGVGQAVNLSSGGVLVVSRHELNVGEELEVRIEWPPLLDGLIPLQLVAVGSVVRCETSSFAVCFRRYQFRTVRRPVQPIATSVFRTTPRRLGA